MDRYEAITQECVIAVLAAVEEPERIEISHPQTDMAAAFRAIAAKLPACISLLEL